MNKKYLLGIAALICLSLPSFANEEIEMADMFMQNGKIYVVLAVIVIIFAGISLYLISMDKRLRKLEKSK